MRLPREPTNPERLKGFGYAEFEDIDSLFQALSLNEEVSSGPQVSAAGQALHSLGGVEVAPPSMDLSRAGRTAGKGLKRGRTLTSGSPGEQNFDFRVPRRAEL